MQNVSQASRTNGQAPTLHLGTFRRNILAVVLGNDLFTDSEQQRAAVNVPACQEAARLVRWVKNVRRVAAARQEARQLVHFSQAIEQGKALATPAPRFATPAQCDELYRLACHPLLTSADKAHTLHLLPTLTEGAALATIGQLYATVLRRAGQGYWRAGSTFATA